MSNFYHFMNMRSPIDISAQSMLLALQDGYRLSLPIEADLVPGITPVPQAEMIKNGIIGIYVTLEASQREEMAPYIPMIQMPMEIWLAQRVRL